MKISIIAWDASFRESFHTIDYFIKEIKDRPNVHFIWVEFYNSTEEVREKIRSINNAHLLEMGRSPKELWNLGRMMNAGLRSLDSDVVFFIDGDVLPPPSFIDLALDEYSKFPPHALYVRRWDEKGPVAFPPTLCLESLEKGSRPAATLNYAPCLIASRHLINAVGGWSEHQVFDGPGGIAGELAIRIRNAGIPHVWSKELKVFHPWHSFSGTSKKNPLVSKQRKIMENISVSGMVNCDKEKIDTWIRNIDNEVKVGRHNQKKDLREMIKRIYSRIIPN